MQKRSAETTVAEGGQNPIAGLWGRTHTRWELTTRADFTLCLHQLLNCSDTSLSKIFLFHLIWSTKEKEKPANHIRKFLHTNWKLGCTHHYIYQWASSSGWTDIEWREEARAGVRLRRNAKTSTVTDKAG